MNNVNEFSIVIPTYYEAKNITNLVSRIANVPFRNAFEVLLIDDNSNDGIVDIVNELKPTYPWLRIIVRTGKKDLSQSVIEGFDLAKYPTLVTIDADLSHPPEKIPAMLEALSKPEVDIVLGSRYIPGGSMDQVWPISRKIVSRLSAWVARILLGLNLKDPLSGFVAINKSTLENGDPLDVVGWKWGLEIMIKCKCKNIVEVPIHFSQRQHGYSKLNLNAALNYFKHIRKLMYYKMFTKRA